MDFEYGIKTANKFLISEFTGADDDEIVEDPSEILQRLTASTLKDDKNASNLKKKQQQLKKSANLANAAAKSAGKTNTISIPAPNNNNNRLSDRTKPERNAFNKENDMSNDNARDATGQRGFIRGARNQQGRGGIARTRLPPRQDRPNMPPRFRSGQENDMDFPQEKPFDSQNMESNNNVPNRQPGFGSGFGDNNGPAGPEDSDNVEGGRQQFNRPNRGFGGRGGGRFNNFEGGRGGGGFGGGFESGGRGGPVGAYRPRNRPLDRQSGSNKTGVKAVDKRDGAGAHNWGSAADDVSAAANNIGDESLTAPGADSTLADADKQQTGGEMDVSAPISGEDAPAENWQQENAEQEPVQLTLDEWKAKQAPKSTPQFNVRRAGEGEKNPAWEKLKPLKGGRADESSKKKKHQDVEEEEEEEEYEIIQEDPKIVPMDIRFIGEPARRPRGGGRGRGGPGRGGMGAGGPGRGAMGAGGPERGGMGGGFGSRGANREREGGASQKVETPYKIDDESFPSLS